MACLLICNVGQELPIITAHAEGKIISPDNVSVPDDESA